MHIETKLFIDCTVEEEAALRHAHHMFAVRLGNRHETLPLTVDVSMTPEAARATLGLLTIIFGKPDLSDDLMRTKPAPGVIPDLPANSTTGYLIRDGKLTLDGARIYQQLRAAAENGTLQGRTLTLRRLINLCQDALDRDDASASRGVTGPTTITFDNWMQISALRGFLSMLAVPRKPEPTFGVNASDPVPLLKKLYEAISATIFRNASPISMVEWSTPNDMGETSNGGWRLAPHAAQEMAESIHDTIVDGPERAYWLGANGQLYVYEGKPPAQQDIAIDIVDRANLDSQTDIDRAAKVFRDLKHAIDHMLPTTTLRPVCVLFTAQEIACALKQAPYAPPKDIRAAMLKAVSTGVMTDGAREFLRAVLSTLKPETPAATGGRPTPQFNTGNTGSGGAGGAPTPIVELFNSASRTEQARVLAVNAIHDYRWSKDDLITTQITGEYGTNQGLTPRTARQLGEAVIDRLIEEKLLP